MLGWGRCAVRICSIKIGTTVKEIGNEKICVCVGGFADGERRFRGGVPSENGAG